MNPNAQRLADLLAGSHFDIGDVGGFVAAGATELAAWLDAQGVRAPAALTLAAPVVPRPYDSDALDDAIPHGGWADIPIVDVPTDRIVPTQEGLGLDAAVRIANGGEAADTDGCGPAPWLVAVDDSGWYFTHNGHTRWLIDGIRGLPTMSARVATPAGQPWSPR